MTRNFLITVAMLALPLAMPAAAKEYDWGFETRAVKDSATVGLDPAKGYILLQSPGALPATFFKVPTEAEIATNQRLRAEALAKDREKWAKKMADYKADMASWKPGSTRPKPEKPVEPTEASYSWPPVETKFMTSVGPFNRFAKGKANSLYLQEVPPGEYVYYGSVQPLLGVGACACMGTVKFQVEPGKVTMLRYDGVFLDKYGKPLSRVDRPEGQEMADTLVRSGMIIEPATVEARDQRIPAEALVPARLTPMAFVPNWYGAEINRLVPIAGLFDYRGGKQIDLATAGESVGPVNTAAVEPAAATSSVNQSD